MRKIECEGLELTVYEVPEQSSDTGLDPIKFLGSLDQKNPMLIGIKSKYFNRVEWKYLIDGNWGRYGIYCNSIFPKPGNLIGYKPKAYFDTAGEYWDYPNYNQRILLNDEFFKELLEIKEEKVYLYLTSCIYDNLILLSYPKYVGEFDTDFGGALSCVIENPFDFEKQDLAKVARVYSYAIREGGMTYWHNMRYVEIYFEKFKLKGKKIVHAEGNYCGRAGCNSWNTGLGEKRETILENISSLEELSYAGCRILKIC